MTSHPQKPEEAPELTSLCVFCGSAAGADPRHGQAAVRLGQLLAEAGITLVYGGGHLGLMGKVAEATLNAGGRVVGIIPEHLVRAEAAFLAVSELIVVDSMHSRKRQMFDRAEAFCVLPGGLGTLDETFEILTWKQLRLHNKPVVLANLQGFWTPWLTMIDGIVQNGFAHADIGRLFSVVEDIEAVIPAARGDSAAALAGDIRLF